MKKKDIKKKNSNNKKKKSNVNKYLIVLICFMVVMSLSLLFFMYRFNNISIKNDANHLLKDLYNLETGKYSLRKGIIYQNDYKVSLNEYFNASGDIEVDKYNNVRFNLLYEGKCISKTYMGNIEMNKGKCSPFKTIDVKINRNNNKISFISSTKNLEYKISYEDDFIGEWVQDDYKDNPVLRKYNEGTNYIWFKDSDGNLSDVLTFKVDCLNTSKTEYDSSVFYCSGSTVKLDGIDFVVIKDDVLTIKLMKFLPIDKKINHCFDSNNGYCFYKKDEKYTYNWDNSYVNYYLNNDFIKELSNETRNALIDSEICTDLNSKCGEELCIGRSRDEINRKNYTCRNYSTSKVKIISYEEFNYVYSKATNKNVLNGYYSMINSFYSDYGSAVQYDQSVYVYENLNKEMNIKPVIVLFK